MTTRFVGFERLKPQTKFANQSSVAQRLLLSCALMLGQLDALRAPLLDSIQIQEQSEQFQVSVSR